ncbi:predicted protein [Chaetomium globosum CBS 148.51]|uniref:Uncharacterized protein n=1 Tax=Chaetomium globosum (strain ATCC 6205 / CBS 148.51 / DSM 1962 / NBRC 6347 / NRRL 1970) TaxID=306901 RepID=Q2HBY9_CHAGB|nr:uncharacterized protein CHGG_02265 [Chaetomium globosum CBS 148.51]EAQ90330.1 predicted protein [Chaetomium globosum CBS 148.51]
MVHFPGRRRQKSGKLALKAQHPVQVETLKCLDQALLPVLHFPHVLIITISSKSVMDRSGGSDAPEVWETSLLVCSSTRRRRLSFRFSRSASGLVILGPGCGHE